MKALQFFGKHDLRFVELPEPQLNEDEILMKIKKWGYVALIYTSTMVV